MLKLRDIMTRDVITVTPDLHLREAMELLTSRHIGGAPVVAGRTIMGVVSTSDLMGFAATHQDAPRTTPDREHPRDIDDDAGDAESWSWDDTSGPAAAYFTGSWNDDEAGTRDCFTAFMQSDLDPLDERTVADVMTAHACSLPSTASVTEAAEYMRRAAIHRLLVIDAGELMGIVSTMDITRAVADHKLVSRTYVFGEPRVLDSRERKHALGIRRAVTS